MRAFRVLSKLTRQTARSCTSSNLGFRPRSHHLFAFTAAGTASVGVLLFATAATTISFSETSDAKAPEGPENLDENLSLEAARRYFERGIDDLTSYSPISYRRQNSEFSILFHNLPGGQLRGNPTKFIHSLVSSFYGDLEQLPTSNANSNSTLTFKSPTSKVVIQVSQNSDGHYNISVTRQGGLRLREAKCALAIFRASHGANPTSPSAAMSRRSMSEYLRTSSDWLWGKDGKGDDNSNVDKDNKEPQTPEELVDSIVREMERSLRGFENTMRRAVPEGASTPDDAVNSTAAEPANPIDELERLGARVYRPNEHGSLSWDHLASSHVIKSEVEDSVLLAMKHQALYDEVAERTRKRFESNLPRAVLFSGPPGTGKTTVARIIASQTDTTLVYVPTESIVSKWYGEGEQKLAKLLAECRKLDNGAIVFVDEIDALAQDRNASMHEATRRLLSVLLRNVDGFESSGRVVLLGATNRPQDLDKALLSRFDVHIKFDLPDERARAEIFRNYAKHLSDSDINQLAAAAQGMAGRSIRDVCSGAERHWAGKRARNEVKGVVPPLQSYLDTLQTKLTLHKLSEN